MFHDSDVSGGGGTSTAEFDTGFGFDIAAGFALKESFRAEGEIGYRSADVDKVGNATASGSSLGVLSFMANGYYDITQFKLPVTPYAGVGLGFLNGKLKSPGSSDSDTTIGYQLMLGASYPLNKQVSVTAGYKLQGAFSDFEKSGVKTSYASSNLMIGARYNF